MHIRSTVIPRTARTLAQVLLAAVLCCIASNASAQSIGDLGRPAGGPGAFYNFAEAADVTIRVHVWGTIRNPGLYEIPQGTRLSTLLSIAGGPSVTPQENRSVRSITFRIYRENGSSRSASYEATMTNQVFIGDEDPVLQAGDLLAVETNVRQRIGWRDALAVISSVASVTLVIDRIVRR